MRLYFNPAYLESLSADEAAATILHEVSHLHLKHHNPAERFASPQDRASWKRRNYAADFVVNSNLIAEEIKIGDDWALPAQAGLENDLTAEQYYQLLKVLEQEQPTQSGKGCSFGRCQSDAGRRAASRVAGIARDRIARGIPMVLHCQRRCLRPMRERAGRKMHSVASIDADACRPSLIP